jgi:hypothetical protein
MTVDAAQHGYKGRETMNEDATKLTLNATMNLDGTEVPMEATVDMLQFHKANAAGLFGMMTDDETPTLRKKQRDEHLGSEHVRASRFWSGEFGQMMHAITHQTITARTSDWKLDQGFIHFTNGSNIIVQPDIKHFPVPDEEDIPFTMGVALATFKGNPVEVSLWVDNDGDSNIRIIAAKNNKGILKEIMQGLEDATFEFLEGKVLDGRFNLISRKGVSRDDVILEPNVRSMIQRHIIDYRRHMTAIQAAGEDPSRGLLMAGPPGCGKTSASRMILSAMPDITAVMVSSTTIQADGFRTIWNLVKRTNGLLILEDIDACGGLSRQMTDHPLLGQLLELLDGLEGSGCVQVIATTNHIEKLDAALTARPGRFDRIITVGPPNAEARRELLRRSLNRLCPGTNLDLEKAVVKTAGFTGAYVAELAKSAWIESLQDGGKEILSSHLNTALQEVMGQFTLALDGHRSSELRPAAASSIGGWE